MKLIFTLVFCITTSTFFAQNDYFFQGKNFDTSIPSPAQFLGYDIGTHHTRYDKMVEYFKMLDKVSDKVSITTIGRTWEHREQIIVHISIPKNIANTESIRQNHLKSIKPGVTASENGPVITWLGYNVHGNEPSGGEASLLTAYYLVACNDKEVITWLENSYILMEPVINPDGRDRHTNWANMHKASPFVTDPLDREHNEVFPGGRTNHYWFDLNRDWFLAVHPESTNRLKYYHEWLPNVVTDFHEMGTNSTFFFEPSKENAESPIVPKSVYRDLNVRFAKYFEEAMNTIGSLYYTKESFDNLYPGYGSSYPDLHGGLGLLFEQGSSRGHAQESQHGVVTFAFTIRNQLVNAIATVKAAYKEKAVLQSHQQRFFTDIIKAAEKDANKGVIVGDAHDLNRNKAFWSLLNKHKIQAYNLTKDENISGVLYKKNYAVYITYAQEQNLVIHSIFDKATQFADSLFYDASTWNLAYSYNLDFANVKAAPVLGSVLSADDLSLSKAKFSKSDYAYLIDIKDYNVYKLTQKLYTKDIYVKSSLKPFTIDGKAYPRGTLLLPVKGQKPSSEDIYKAISEAAESTGLTITPMQTGMSSEGIDLGSNLVQTLTVPKIAMLTGQGFNSYEAGEIWHLMDTKVELPISKIDISNLGRIEWSRYNTLIIPGGNASLSKELADNIKSWIAQGNTLITTKEGTNWAIKNQLMRESLREEKIDSTALKQLNFEDVGSYSGARRTNGAIFETKLDLTHPIAFGYTKSSLPVYRNNNTIQEVSKQAGRSPVRYTATPLLSGYVHNDVLKLISNSSAVNIGYEGRGRVISFSDNPCFRGVWFGTNRMFLNAIFLSNLMGQ
jgi:hypothetical protein